MKIAPIIFLILLLWGCETPTKHIQQEEYFVFEEEVQSVQDEAEFDVVEEVDVPLTFYQKARLKHPEKEILPMDVVLRNTDEIPEYTILNFEGILKTQPNWFLCKYYQSEGEVEEVFFITFDYNGNQLDAKLVIAFAEDLNGSFSFITDTTFVATQRIDEVELNDDDNLIILSSREEIEQYTITESGMIQPLVQSLEE